MAEIDNEWLQNLKVGDEVIVQRHLRSGIERTLTTVSEILPRLIVVSGGMKFRKRDGHYKRSVEFSPTCVIVAATEAEKTAMTAALRKRELVKRLYDIDLLKSQHLATLEAIAALLEPKEVI